MIHPGPKPNFGHFICHKLLQASEAKVGSVFCSSVITILGRHRSLRLCFPSDLEKLPGARYLDMTQMMKMNMFLLLHTEQIWLKGTRHCKHFVVHKHQHHKLSLAEPVQETNWLLKRNIGVTDEEATSDIDSDNDLEEPVNQDSTNQQMDHDTRFNTMETRLIALQADVNLMRTELSDQRSMLRLMYAHQHEMGRSIASLRNLLLKQPDVPPAPPPE
ncbi:hypothetical protein E3N88_29717 [Mikania micrantha]|uniref:Uncharacterized protein n=1 Tax=Mikania micrantha TaxID=192012 RepID=A0A5N6MMH7_9ASTR|nr:hypothetical protein E3N88_29717 [Mikania micrantha]